MYFIIALNSKLLVCESVTWRRIVHNIQFVVIGLKLFHALSYLNLFTLQGRPSCQDAFATAESYLKGRRRVHKS